MRIAWFRPARATDGPIDPSDDTALLIGALRARHAIEIIDAARAHDFVWQQARHPAEMCVFELGGSDAHRFISAYAAHYSGIVMLRGVPRHDRALRAARLVVTPHEPVSQALEDDYPGIRVRTLTPGVEPLPGDMGAVITALRWPPDGAALTYALSGFAARRAVIVFDGPETADWPSLDPQNWNPRHQLAWREPICISIDPRDEAHSLRLALRRLERDPELGTKLGDAAHAWWRAHATVEQAAAGFERLLDEARSVSPPLDVAGAQPHSAPGAHPGAVADDGSGLARQILSDCGVPWPWTGDPEARP